MKKAMMFAIAAAMVSTVGVAEGTVGVITPPAPPPPGASPEASAYTLLANELKDFDPVRQIFDIRLVRGEDLIEQGLAPANPVALETLPDGRVRMRLYYEIYPDQARYAARMTRLTQVLTQVSIGGPRPFAPRLVPIMVDDAALAKQNANIAEGKQGATAEGMADGMLLKKSYWLEDGQYKSERTAKDLKVPLMDPNTVSVVMEMTPARTGLKGYDFLLPEPLMALYTQWSDGYLWDDTQRNKSEKPLTVKYVVQLLDETGAPVAEATVPVRKVDLLLGNEGSVTFERRPWHRAARAEWVPLVHHGKKYANADGKRLPKDLQKMQSKLMSNLRDQKRYAEVYRNYVDLLVPPEAAGRVTQVQLRLQAVNGQP